METMSSRDYYKYKSAIEAANDSEDREALRQIQKQLIAKYGLDNLVIFLDRNRLQNDGTCAEVMPNGDLAAKFSAFGCQTWEIDGHSMNEILDVLEAVRADRSGKP